MKTAEDAEYAEGNRGRTRKASVAVPYRSFDTPESSASL